MIRFIFITFIIVVLNLLIMIGSYGLNKDIKKGVISTSSNIVQLNGERIASLAPSITEILYALGLGSKVVGNTIYCNYPEDAKSKAKIGTLTNINYEQLMHLQVDTIIMPAHMNGYEKRFVDKGFNVVIVDHRGINGIMNSIDTIGKVFNIKSRSDKLLNDIYSRIDKVKDFNNNYKPKVLFSIFRNTGSGDIDDLIVVGNDNFYSDFIKMSGGLNPLERLSVAYPSLSKEGVISINPDIIIELTAPGDDPKTVYNDWFSVKEIKAVKKDRICIISDQVARIPGPRFIDILEIVSNCINNNN